MTLLFFKFCWGHNLYNFFHSLKILKNFLLFSFLTLWPPQSHMHRRWWLRDTMGQSTRAMLWPLCPSEVHHLLWAKLREHMDFSWHIQLQLKRHPCFPKKFKKKQKTFLLLYDSSVYQCIFYLGFLILILRKRK